MKRILILIFIVGLAFISIGAKSFEKFDSDEQFRNKIVGSWAEGDNPYTIATFENGGNYYGKAWKTPEKNELILCAEGKWWIENGRLYNTVHKIEPPLIPPTEKPIVDIIVNISDDVMTLIDDKGQQYKKTKVK